MLRTLSIRNLVLIDALEVTFGPGLNVITGETGAGKSVVLDCLGFVLGSQNRAIKLRPGAQQGEAVAVFTPEPLPLIAEVLAEAGISVGDELIVRRTLTPDGRRQAYVNDRRVTVDTLRSLSDVLVELHGQQDDRGLMDERRHRDFLDTFAELEDSYVETRSTWRTFQEEENQLQSARTVRNDMMRDIEYLSQSVEELTTLNPRPDEVTSLELRRRSIKTMERIRSSIEHAATCVGTQGIEANALEALKALENAREQPDAAEGAPFIAAIEQSLRGLNRIFDELASIQHGVEECLMLVNFDPDELQGIEDRLFAVRALARKHQVSPNELWRVATECRNRLAACEYAESHIIEMEKAVSAARQQYESAARCLSEARRAAASRLDRLMAAELDQLKLERAKFETQIVRANPGPDGVDGVRFCVSTIAELAPGPIDKVASGGELSRLMLALKVCLSGRSSKITMIFDEIDRGVGGVTAEAVATRLKRISETSQVIVVTHSAQVAARATLHLAVERFDSVEGERMRVITLNYSERIEEISRMVAGEKVTNAVREAARHLMARADSDQSGSYPAAVK